MAASKSAPTLSSRSPTAKVRSSKLSTASPRTTGPSAPKSHTCRTICCAAPPSCSAMPGSRWHPSPAPPSPGRAPTGLVTPRTSRSPPTWRTSTRATSAAPASPTWPTDSRLRAGSARPTCSGASMSGRRSGSRSSTVTTSTEPGRQPGPSQPASPPTASARTTVRWRRRRRPPIRSTRRSSSRALASRCRASARPRQRRPRRPPRRRPRRLPSPLRTDHHPTRSPILRGPRLMTRAGLIGGALFLVLTALWLGLAVPPGPRAAYEAWFIALVLVGTRLPGPANQVTLARAYLAVPGLVYGLQPGGLGALAVTVALASLTDLLDGTVARRFAQPSNLGGALDPVVDGIFFGAVAAGLALGGAYPIWLALVVVLRYLLPALVGGVLVLAG